MASTKSTGGTKKSPGKKKTPAAKKSPKTAKKTGARAKKPARKNGPKAFHEVKKTVLGIAILIAVCLTTAMLVDIFIKTNAPVAPENQTAGKTTPEIQPRKPSPAPIRPKPEPGPGQTKQQKTNTEPRVISRAKGLLEKQQPSTGKKHSVPPESRKDSTIVYEVYEDVTPTPPKKVVPPKKADLAPRIAIIIDDIGYDKALAMGLFNLDRNITFSILPFSPSGKQLAKTLSAKGAELMLHIPMEPTQYPKVNPGPGALLSAMSPDELLDQLRKDIHAIPGTVGANNHMGSRLTADSDKMNQIFTVLKQHNLFFIDSRTSAQSKGEQSARMFQIKFSQRDIFLDNFQNVDYISGQLEKLVKLAKAHGSAIGIGHPHKTTLAALKKELPGLKGKVRLVPAGSLVTVPPI